MKILKDFKSFVAESYAPFSDEKYSFLSNLGSIILGKQSYHEPVSNPESDENSSSPNLLNPVDYSSIKGGYSPPNFSSSSKYSVLSRYPSSYRDNSKIFQICLHHTDGENKRGEDVIKFVFGKGKAYSVHYAIGRDGQLFQGSPENEVVWASNGLNSHSISIELATGGSLILKNNKWIDSYPGTEIQESLYPLIVDLGFKYNGYRYYLDYTDGQMRSLKEFIDLMIKKYPKIKEGMKGNVYTSVFGIPEPELGGDYKSKKLTSDEAKNPGVFVHAIAPGASHVDCFPSSKLVNLLKQYGYTGKVIESKKMYSSENSYSDKEKLEGVKIGKSIVIGDSLVPYVAKGAGIQEGPKAKDINNSGKNGLWFGGISIISLLNFAKDYKNIDSSVKNVVISIGTNGIFTRSTKTIKSLMDRLKVLFPNAKILVVKGAYGSKLVAYPALQKVSQSTVDSFYSDFTDNGAVVIPTPVGNVTDPHGHLPVYKIIGKEIQQKLQE